jgi:hypothetical protein
LDAAPVPLTFHQSELYLGAGKIPLSFAFDRQQFAERLATAGGETMHELTVGSGKIYVTNDPVELAESLEPTVTLYRWLLATAGVETPFTGSLPSAGVLLRRAVLRDSSLYLFVSESARDEQVAVRDQQTGAEFNFLLASRRARLVLLDRHSRKVLAAFGNE